MFVLYNCAHLNASIKSSGDAWIRILGFFQSKTEAFSYTKILTTYDTGLEVRIAPINEFRMILSSKYNDKPNELDMITRERESEKLNKLLELHLQSRTDAFAETSNNAKERIMGELKFKATEKIEEYKIQLTENQIVNKENLISQTLIFDCVKPISNNFIIRMQRFAAISVIPDYIHNEKIEQNLLKWESEMNHYNKDTLKEFIEINPLPSTLGAEPAISFLKYGDTEEEISIWIKNECRIKDSDIACVSMYEWINLKNIWSDKIKRIFREPLVQKLHENKEFQHKESIKIEGQVKEILISSN